jgi:predicted nucleotidyltransferase
MNFDRYLESIKLAGSHAKGTELRDSDYDLFLTYSPGTPDSLLSEESPSPGKR